MENIKKITIGNDYDSRIGNHSYAMWTSGYDIRIEELNGNIVYFRVRDYDMTTVERIDPPAEMKNERQVYWKDLSINIKESYFDYLYPEGAEEERNIFVYGDEKGRAINERNKWADSHMVWNRETTLYLARKLGRFSDVKFLKTITSPAGRGYNDYLFLIDNHWQVKVFGDSAPKGQCYLTEIKDYCQIQNQKKEFGRRASKRAKKADVPWKIAVFAGNIASDEEAVEILKKIKATVPVSDEALIWELTKCGIGRRTAAIKNVLGEDVWTQLKCNGQKQTRTLALYLVYEL